MIGIIMSTWLETVTRSTSPVRQENGAEPFALACDRHLWFWDCCHDRQNLGFDIAAVVGTVGY
jgi:hypothetical protein